MEKIKAKHSSKMAQDFFDKNGQQASTGHKEVPIVGAQNEHVYAMVFHDASLNF